VSKQSEGKIVQGKERDSGMSGKPKSEKDQHKQA